MVGKLEVLGLAAVVGVVVFALVLRQGPRRRMTSGLGRAARHLYRLKQRDQLLPRVRQFIDGIGR